MCMFLLQYTNKLKKEQNLQNLLMADVDQCSATGNAKLTLLHDYQGRPADLHAGEELPQDIA